MTAVRTNDEEEGWDDDDVEWHRIEQNKRTCLMRRTCAIGILIVYAFLILNWRIGRSHVDPF